MKKVISLILTLALALSCAAVLAEVVPANPTMPAFAEIDSGKLMGFVYDDVYTFRGIPYAQAERFEMPQPVDAWEDYLAVLNFSEVCPQHQYSRNVNDFCSVSNYFVEDREENAFLTVNVWTTDMNPETPKPVLFWIHGGGYGSGSSGELELYDGHNLAKWGDVVFVSVNHRLNYLGYMDVSAYGEEYKYSANLGHADLIAALEWVQRNIASFGGDPNNVTIEGQSGGGTKVTQLMGMPAAKDLFHKALAQSGASVKVTRTTEQAQAETAKLVEYLGLSDKSNEEIMAALKTMPYDELYDACRAAGTNYGATVDGDYYPTGTYELSAGKPFMVGSVLGEFTTQAGWMTGKTDPKFMTDEILATHFAANVSDESVMERVVEQYGERANEVIEAFKAAYPNHPLMDVLYLSNRNNANAEFFASNGGTVYQYVQAWDPPYMGGTTAQHTAGDIPYWFRTITNTDAVFMIAGNGEEALKLTDEMSGALVSFCYTGNPSTETLEWKPFTVENGETMVFDSESQTRNYHDKALFDLINEIKSAK